ncbi:MobF family relaxase [Aeromicrobium sp.]|uniref:MobF family relaxase n=1 Tax=Aeromicrobium sp. TaxID=1871063 RepID=UPI0025C08EDF|nr:MobF family relaxase [Aeromicrobium sp.]
MSRPVHGGVKFYRGSPGAARTYVEADRSRVDDYYLAEGTGLATRYVAGTTTETIDGQELRGERGEERGPVAVRNAGMLDGDAYEQWVGGYDTTRRAKGHLRTDEHGLRLVEVVINGPKTWSLAAALHPAVAEAYDAAQERAAGEIIGWLAEHATTRIGPRGRQVQVPVDEIEAAVVRHYTSRAGDPHRHLHVQINARVRAGGRWRGLHSVGVVDSIEAINGIGHAAVMCDPQLRESLATHGYTLDPATGDVRELAPFAGEFSARASQIARNVDRYEAEWRGEHPGQEPGPNLRRTWDRRAWSQARPDKVVPADGEQLARRWVSELHDLGFTTPTAPTVLVPTAVGRLNRDAVSQLALSRLGARRSSWNAADIRGEVEKIIASVDVVVDPRVRRELAEDLVARTIAACEPLLARDDVPEHVRALTSKNVLEVEADLVDRLAARATTAGEPERIGPVVARVRLDPAQQRTVAALAGTGRLIVVEGAAGAGKTTTLAAAGVLLQMRHQQLVVVTPTLKAAQVAGAELGTPAFSAAWLAYQHGYRWDDDGHWTRQAVHRDDLDVDARLSPGDVLLVDEAGMLDQDTARALLSIADETGARLALVGDRHQLAAVGRGGVLDHAARWAHPENQVTLDAVHRFSDPDYADLTLKMRTGREAGEVFDKLYERGDIVIHPTDVERLAAVAQLAAGSPGDLIVADTHEQVAALNATIRDHHLPDDYNQARQTITTDSGDKVAVGDRIATRRNDRDLDVANRDQWTITNINHNGDLTLDGQRGTRTLPADYVNRHVELAYATTTHGAQGETVDQARLLLGESTGAASAYVAMTRGRHHNTAHLVAGTIDDARTQWVETFNRDRADLGPAHAADAALEAIDRYGPLPPSSTTPERPEPPAERSPRRREPPPVPRSASGPRPGIGR